MRLKDVLVLITGEVIVKIYDYEDNLADEFWMASGQDKCDVEYWDDEVTKIYCENGIIKLEVKR